MIDRLLGGAGKLSSVPRRPLTEIELRLAARITAAVLEVLAKAWRGVAEIGFGVDRVESDPHAAKLLVPHEAVLHVGLELTINAAHGPLSLCLPLGALRPIADQLALGPIATGARAITTRQSDAPSAETCANRRSN